MTTILYCHKTKEIGIDSRMTADNLIVNENAKKYFKHEDGTWFFSGCPIDMNGAIQILSDDYTERRIYIDSEHKIKFSAIIARLGTVYAYYYCSDGCYIIEKAENNEGFGTGGSFGLCALDFGLSVYDAIKYASEKDNCTNDNIYIHKIY